MDTGLPQAFASIAWLRHFLLGMDRKSRVLFETTEAVEYKRRVIVIKEGNIAND